MTRSEIARRVQVSPYLLYKVEAIRRAANEAIAESRSWTTAEPEPTASQGSLRTDLALAREEVRDLRAENRRLRTRLQEANFNL
jgi:hypothetical protein